MFLLTLYAGSMADRHSRRTIVMISLGVEIICVLGLVSVAHEAAPNVTHIFWIAAAFGAARAFLSPAASALVPMLVPKVEDVFVSRTNRPASCQRPLCMRTWASA